MKGIICLEGPDASGKTTLAKYFEEHHGARVLHLTYRFRKSMPVYQMRMIIRALALSRRQLVVLDRHWLSECVYAAVYRGGHKWPKSSRHWLHLFEELGILTILCLPSSVEQGVERHRANIDPDHAYDDANFRAIVEHYMDVWHGNMFWGRKHDASDLLIRRGGAWTRAEYMRYTIDNDGADMGQFAKKALKRAKMLQKSTSRHEWLIGRIRESK